MVNVNQTFINLINSGNYIEEISGTLKNGSGTTVLNLKNDFIKNGSLTIDNKCINNKDLEPGAVYSAELKIAITAEAGLTNAQKNSLQNGSLNLTYTVKDFETEETSASCTLGVYYITAVEMIDDETVITAEDLLSRMSRNITNEDRETLEANGFTPYELLLMAAEACSTTHRPIVLANDEAEFDEWTNSAEVFMLPETADIATYRDLVAEVAAVLGCFATVDKASNGLILKRLNPHTNSNIYTVPDDLQFENTKSSYVCKTGKVYLGDNYFYPATEDDEVNGLILCMKKTQLTNDAAQIETIVSGLYDELSEYTYRPARIVFLGNPALEAGDWIGVNYKLIDEEGEVLEDVYTYRTIITHTLWEFGGEHLLEATGSSLATTKKIGAAGSDESAASASIRNIESKMQSVEENSNYYLISLEVNERTHEIIPTYKYGSSEVSNTFTFTENAGGNITSIHNENLNIDIPVTWIN